MEIVVAFAVFGFILSTIIPAWIQLNVNLEAAYQRSIALQLVQNELVQFRGYFDTANGVEVESNGYLFFIKWEIQDLDGLQEGRLTITWHPSSKVGEELSFVTYRKSEALL